MLEVHFIPTEKKILTTQTDTISDMQKNELAQVLKPF